MPADPETAAALELWAALRDSCLDDPVQHLTQPELRLILAYADTIEPTRH